MQTLTDTCEQVVERAERGLDVVVAGEAAAVSAALQAATLRLEATHGVVTVTGSSGGLSLSGLIAQLSGRGNLDDHDDSVLELGVRRLTDAAVPGQRTVMVLDAPSGVHRSAFRFLRQVRRGAPDLVYVIASFPEMAAMLDEPGMEALRERFGAALVVADGVWDELDEPEADAAGESRALVLAVTSVAPAAVTIPPEWRDLRAVPLSARDEGRRRRRSAVLTASAMGVAASVSLGAWLGTRTSSPAPVMQAFETVPATDVAPVAARRPVMTMAAVPAQVTAPMVAASSPPPVAGVTPAPGLVALPGADLAKVTRPEMATVAAPGVASSSIAEASLAADMRNVQTVLGRDEAAGDGVPVAELPREASNGRTRGAARSAKQTVPEAAPKPTTPEALSRLAALEAPTRLATPDSPTRLAAPEERRRVLSPKPQRLATLPMAPPPMLDRSVPESRARTRWHREEPLDEEASRDLRTYPGDPEQGPEQGAETYTPPVRYRRYSPPEPVWRGERAVAPVDGPYIGTYEPGPYGARVFRYER